MARVVEEKGDGIARVAAIQLAYTQLYPGPSGAWLPAEPLTSLRPLDPLQYGETHLLEALRQLLPKEEVGHKDWLQQAIQFFWREYYDNLKDKALHILQFCAKHWVDIVLFPEYSIPPQLFLDLTSKFPNIIVIAGLGYMRQTELDVLAAAGININKIEIGNNIAAVARRSKVELVSKRNHADHESIEQGEGPKAFPLSEFATLEPKIEQISNHNTSLVVCICLDWPFSAKTALPSKGSIACIPSLTDKLKEFLDSSRDAVVIFANHAAYGGTYIGAPNLMEAPNILTNARGSEPLEANIEGLVVVDVDIINMFPSKYRRRSTNPQHKLYARSAFIYDADSGLANTYRDYEISDGSVPLEQLASLASRIVECKDLNPLIERQFVHVRDHIGDLKGRERQALTTHLLLRRDIKTLEELRLGQSDKVYNYISNT